jgi:anti-sigma regulatory factor (Ser/Thr protein kinase)
MKHAKEVMRLRRVSGLPVLEAGSLAGIVSVEDVIRWLEGGAGDASVEDWMTKKVHTVRNDEAAVQAINRFYAHKVGRLPVVDAQGKLVGIVTPGDIINQVVHILDSLYREAEATWPREGFDLKDIASEGTTLVLRYAVVAGDLESAGSAATRIKRILDGLGVEPHLVRRAGIAAYEAEMNLAIHTDRGGQMTAEIGRGMLKIEVRDDGPGIVDLEQALTPGFSTAPDWIRELGFGAGMGLNNIKKCSDRFSVESEVGKGTVLRVCIDLGGGIGNSDAGKSQDAEATESSAR